MDLDVYQACWFISWLHYAKYAGNAYVSMDGSIPRWDPHFCSPAARTAVHRRFRHFNTREILTSTRVSFEPQPRRVTLLRIRTVDSLPPVSYLKLNAYRVDRQSDKNDSVILARRTIPGICRLLQMMITWVLLRMVSWHYMLYACIRYVSIEKEERGYCCLQMLCLRCTAHRIEPR